MRPAKISIFLFFFQTKWTTQGQYSSGGRQVHQTSILCGLFYTPESWNWHKPSGVLRQRPQPFSLSTTCECWRIPTAKAKCQLLNTTIVVQHPTCVCPDISRQPTCTYSQPFQMVHGTAHTQQQAHKSCLEKALFKIVSSSCCSIFLNWVFQNTEAQKNFGSFFILLNLLVFKPENFAVLPNTFHLIS